MFNVQNKKKAMKRYFFGKTICSFPYTLPFVALKLLDIHHACMFNLKIDEIPFKTFSSFSLDKSLLVLCCVHIFSLALSIYSNEAMKSQETQHICWALSFN